VRPSAATKEEDLIAEIAENAERNLFIYILSSATFAFSAMEKPFREGRKTNVSSTDGRSPAGRAGGNGWRLTR
jgi:hypothetical protein